uniref:B box-type domain-containing protein n=1 Tax=Steinernema glaseri TaxID=37863 RepID=A0A1I7ZBR9_9BILA
MDSWSYPELNGPPIVLGRSIYFVDILRKAIDKVDQESSTSTLLELHEACSNEVKDLEMCLLVQAADEVLLVMVDNEGHHFSSTVLKNPVTGGLVSPLELSSPVPLELDPCDGTVERRGSALHQIHFEDNKVCLRVTDVQTSSSSRTVDFPKYNGIPNELTVSFSHGDRDFVFQPRTLFLTWFDHDDKMSYEAKLPASHKVRQLARDYDLCRTAMCPSSDTVYTLYSLRRMAEVASAPKTPLLVATNLETLEVARVNLDFGNSGHIPCVDVHLTIKDSTLYICGKCAEYPLLCKNTHIYTFELETLPMEANSQGACHDCHQEAGERWSCSQCDYAFCASCAVKLHQHRRKIFDRK